VADMERTLVIAKPDAVQRGLVGEILGRLERRGLQLIACKMMQVDRALAEQHYAEHQGKPFFEGLVSFITSSPVVVAVFAGPGAVATVRKTNGATNPANAEPGTVRGDFGVDVGRNLVHASDSAESAAREIGLWFGEGEVLPWERTNERWIRE
jgi:nucleoside-diphosphate kinase